MAGFDQVVNGGRSNGKAARKEAAAFINIHLPSVNADGEIHKGQKLGYLTLHSDNVDHQQILEVLSSNPERVDELVAALIVDFRMNTPKTVATLPQIFK